MNMILILTGLLLKNNNKVLKEASICHSDEYAKCQNQIDKQKKGGDHINSTLFQQNNETIQDNQNIVVMNTKKYDNEVRTTTVANNMRTEVGKGKATKTNQTGGKKDKNCIVF